MELDKNTSSKLSDHIDVPLVTETIIVGTIKTTYLRIGVGRPVVFLHGGGAGALAWHPVVSEISKSFCAIAPDLVGYGESDKPYVFYNRRFFSQWLKGFLDALGLKKCVLIGHSLGGAVALQFAMEHPDQVERLGLVCSAALGLSLSCSPLVKGIVLYSFPSWTTSWRLHASLVYSPENLDEKFIAYAEQVCRKPGGKRAFWGGCGSTIFPIPFGRLKEVTHRTALIWGAEDRVFPLAHARRAMRIMPNVQLHVIPQAGHIPFFDQPRIFNEVLLKFLEDLC